MKLGPKSCRARSDQVLLLDPEQHDREPGHDDYEVMVVEAACRTRTRAGEDRCGVKTFQIRNHRLTRGLWCSADGSSRTSRTGSAWRRSSRFTPRSSPVPEAEAAGAEAEAGARREAGAAAGAAARARARTRSPLGARATFSRRVQRDACDSNTAVYTPRSIVSYRRTRNRHEPRRPVEF